jgi:hypothetical protein
MRLPWVDFTTGDPIRLDLARQRTRRYGKRHVAIGLHRDLCQTSRSEGRRSRRQARARRYNRPPLSVAGASSHLSRIGKEVDRLDTDDGASLAPDAPVPYDSDTLADAIAYLARFPQATIAREIGMSERRWRDIVRGTATPGRKRAMRIRAIAMNYRLRRRGRAIAHVRFTWRTGTMRGMEHACGFDRSELYSEEGPPIRRLS